MWQSGNSNVAPAREIATELAAAKRRAASFAFGAHFRIVRVVSVLLLTVFFARVHLLAQTPVTTWHYDNARTSANTSETALTPSNVNSTSFGKLNTLPVDGFVVATPLYLPNVTVLGQGVHNVVYVATMHDSVYAFDAASTNSSPLWMTSILNYSPAGATTVPSSVKKVSNTTGWTEVGIVSTPVIDSASGTLYLVAETYENGSVVHRLHALDVTSGVEIPGGPITIAATYTLNGVTTTFTDLYELNRPGLLLVNGHIYIGFGSNCCNDYSQGWVLSYNEATLMQEGAYTTEPGKTLASIWQKGGGLSADSSGNIYAETGEGYYAAGTNLSTSVFKLSQSGSALALTDWFTPYNHQYLSQNDLDLANAIVILPDQPGPNPHELVAIGKRGTIYLLNRDNMGQLCSSCTSGDTQIVQEIPVISGENTTPVYWNNTLYFSAASTPVTAYTLNNGALVIPASAQSVALPGPSHALITANGNSNGILWVINGGNTLFAMDAITLSTLYKSNQAANGRDALPPLDHFASPIAADGRVFVGTQNSLVVYGLIPLPNLPDLIETSVTNPPATALDGSTFSVTDTAQNTGTAAAAASTTRYYLSTTTSKGGARLLTGSRAVPSLAPSTTSSGTVTVTVSASTAGGTYFLLACADDTLVVPETNENNNCTASATQVTVSGPDLVESAVSNPPATGTPGSTFSVTDTAQNTGSAAAAASTTRYYLSTTTSKSGARVLTGSRAVPSLAPSATSGGTVTVTVSASTAGGTYFLLACADDTLVVPETNENNNCTASATQVTVSGPDLVESAVSNPPATGTPGSTFSVTDTAQNTGSAAAAASTTRYYLSTTTSKSGARLQTGSRAVPSLAPSATSSGTVTVTVSTATAGGTYFLLACADDTLVVVETNENNNCTASATQVTVSGPDLVESAVSNPPATGTPGSTFSVTDTAQNTGSAAAAASTTRYYLSTTTSKGGARLQTGSRAVPSLAPSAASGGTVTVTVSAGTAGGTYFLLACADDTLVVPETNENNNCMASATQVTVSGADLVESAVSNPPATGTPGSTFSVTDTVQNTGSAAAAASTTRYYLSTTTSKSGARLLTGSRAVPSLAPSATSSGTVTVTVSASTAGGTYFLLACADDTVVVPETNENNNCMASATQVTVTGPDLIESAVSNPPATVNPGSTFSATETVQNTGSAAAAASTTRYYLSTTTSKSGSSILLTGSRSVPSLAPAATSNGNGSVTVPSTLPSGTYFLLACSDDTRLVLETNENNNCNASATTTTY